MLKYQRSISSCFAFAEKEAKKSTIFLEKLTLSIFVLVKDADERVNERCLCCDLLPNQNGVPYIYSYEGVVLCFFLCLSRSPHF